MSIVIAVFAVLVVAILIARYYPHPKTTDSLAKGEMLTPDSEDLIELSSKEEEVHIDPPAITTKPSDEAAAKMTAKPKKKYYHNKNNNKKAKPNK